MRSNENWRNSFVMFQKVSLFWYIYIKNNILEFLAHEGYLFWDKLKVLKVLTSCETKIDWSVEDCYRQHTLCSCQSLRAHLWVHLSLPVRHFSEYVFESMLEYRAKLSDSEYGLHWTWCPCPINSEVHIALTEIFQW